MPVEKLILGESEIEKILEDMSREIYEEFKDLENLAIVGIQTRGVEIGKKIKENIEKISDKSINFGILDITFYRDDLATRGILPVIKETKINFNITKKNIILVDDVIFTGRTTKAAIESLMSFGRPQKIKLAVLVDRGNRELPIQPDYCGVAINTKLSDMIKVNIKEIDGESKVILITE